MEIDIVVTWVDMDDPAWREQFARFSGRPATDNSKNEVSEARFRDYGFLKYWFRGVERFAPWVRRVHFVTCGQKPDWLDASNPKIHLVNHSDFIPERFLPLFNSASIEMWMHKIPELAERFVYFNDDFFLTAPTPPERFFSPLGSRGEGGLPCDIAVFRYNSGVGQWSKRIENNVRLINRHFDKRLVQSEFEGKWFSPEYGGKAWLNRLLRFYPRFVTLRVPHNAQPYLRSTFEDLWAHCEAELLETSTHRFRSTADLTPELIRTWQICRGTFEPYNTYKDTRMFPLVLRPGAAIEAVREQTYRLVCLNDNVHIRNYGQVMADLGAAFESILPDKSSFEL